MRRACAEHKHTLYKTGIYQSDVMRREEGFVTDFQIIILFIENSNVRYYFVLDRHTPVCDVKVVIIYYF